MQEEGYTPTSSSYNEVDLFDFDRLFNNLVGDSISKPILDEQENSHHEDHVTAVVKPIEYSVPSIPTAHFQTSQHLIQEEALHQKQLSPIMPLDIRVGDSPSHQPPTDTVAKITNSSSLTRRKRAKR